MLVLTRHKGQSIIIGDRTIIVTVLSIKGNQVKLGIDAPKGVVVDREEIFLKKKEEALKV